MLPPDALELGRGVLRNLALDIADVALVELGWLPILEDHQVQVFLGGKGQTGKDFKGRTGDATCDYSLVPTLLEEVPRTYPCWCWNP